MIGFLFRLVVAALMLGVVVSGARVAGRIVLGVVRGFLLAVGAALAGTFCGVFAGSAAALLNSDHPIEIGVMTGVVAFAATIFLGGRRRRADPAWQDAPEIVGGGPEQPASRESDPVLAAAWDNALQLAQPDRERVRQARAACARMADLVEEGTLDAALIDCAAFTRRTVPELVSTTQAVLADADPAERSQLLSGLADDLEAIGRRAAAEVQRIGSPLREKHAALRAHVATQVGQS